MPSLEGKEVEMYISRIRTRRKNQKGFTLMELMVVTLILAVVAAYGIPRYLSGIHASKLGMVAANYDAIASDTASAYYDISLVGDPDGTPATTTEEVVAKKVGIDNYDTLKNPFGEHSATRQAVVVASAAVTYWYYNDTDWVTYDGDGAGAADLAGGEIVIDYSASDEITVTAYDDSLPPVNFGGYSKEIDNPR